MRDALSDLARKGVLVALLLVGAWLLLKVVAGVVTAIAWTIVGVLAVVALLYALYRLL